MVCLAENEIRVFKTEGKKNVKITVTSQCLPSYLIVSRIYLCSPSSPLQNIENYTRKKLLALTLTHANSTGLRFFFLTVLATNLYFKFLKDGAYYCYCAYVLRISRYLDFLSVTISKTGIFLRGLKLSGESRS